MTNTSVNVYEQLSEIKKLEAQLNNKISLLGKETRETEFLESRLETGFESQAAVLEDQYKKLDNQKAEIRGLVIKIEKLVNEL